MKNFLGAIFLTLFIMNANAQDSLGIRNSVHLGAGIPNIFASDISNVNGTSTIPLLVGYSYKTGKLLAVGVLFQTGKVSTVDSFNVNGSKYGLDKQYFAIGLRPDYHFGKSPVFDPYIGISLIYFGVNKTERGNVPPNSKLKNKIDESINFGGQLGANYYVFHNVGIFAEVAYGLSYLNAGLSVRF